MQIREAINEIIAKEGLEALKNINRFNAMIDDLAPECVRERKVFRSSLDENILSYFSSNDNKQRLRNLRLIRNELADKGISDNWIRVIIDSFRDCIGWENEITVFIQQEFSDVLSLSIANVDDIRVKTKNYEETINSKIVLEKKTNQKLVSRIDNIINLGIMELSAKNEKKAMIQFKKALEMDGSCIGAFCGLVSVLDIEKSRPYVERMLNFDINEMKDFLNNFHFGISQRMVDNVVCWGNSSVLELFLQMNGETSEKTFYYAVRNKHWKEIIRTLIKNNVDIKKVYSIYTGEEGNVKKYENRTVLSDVFLYRRDYDLCKELIKNGANIEYGVTWFEYFEDKLNGPERFATMLSLAMNYQVQELVEVLLKAGANPNEGIERYVRKGYVHITKYSPLSDALRTDFLRKYIDILIENGADTNYQYTTHPIYADKDNKKKTGIATAPVLLDAILSGDGSMVKKMLDAGANPNSTYTYANEDNDAYWRINEWTEVSVPILDVAIRSNNIEAIKVLIEAGASLEEKCYTHSENFPLRVRDFGNDISMDTKQLIKKYGWKGHKLFKNTYIWYAF